MPPTSSKFFSNLLVSELKKKKTTEIGEKLFIYECFKTEAHRQVLRLDPVKNGFDSELATY